MSRRALRALVALAVVVVCVFAAGPGAAQDDHPRAAEPTTPGAAAPSPAPSASAAPSEAAPSPAPSASAEPGAEPAPAQSTLPTLEPSGDLQKLVGHPITRVEIASAGSRWIEKPTLRFVHPGDTFSSEIARRAMQELIDTGHFANVSADAEAEGAGVVLWLRVVPQRIVASIRIQGGALDADDTLRAADVRAESAVTDQKLGDIVQRVQRYYVRHGFPGATAKTDVIETDDPMQIVLLIDVTPGEPRRVDKRRFLVWPSPKVPGLAELLQGYSVGVGDRADEDDLTNADRELEKDLRARGWHRATVLHELAGASGFTELRVDVKAGPLIHLKFEGVEHFDADQLEHALDLEESEERAPASLIEKIKKFYAERGFYDVEVSAVERGGANAPIHDLVFRVREGALVRVVRREYPCLTGSRTAREVGEEMDSYLSEELPGADFLSSVDPRVVDGMFGPGGVTGARPVPFEPNPWMTYVPEVYDKAMKHVQELYRSEGYLSATVGPPELLRRRCSRSSPPGQCIPVGARPVPKTTCAYDEIGLPLPEPEPDLKATCIPDPAKGVHCEPDAVLHIPIKLGPRTYLWDVAFEGNKVMTEKKLAEVADLELGAPASQVEVDKARRRVLDEYAEEGYAFAEVDATLELSPDHTRGRARFTISERQKVIVSRIVIVGARHTNEGLIRSRIALEVGQPYRRSDVRKTEERLATLAVFSSVTVGFEDPYVPAREKVVVITVQERKLQYLDVRPGFSTGEGFRILFEYGHRNLAGEAIQLTLRVQLGYLPSAFIFEQDVREKYDQLSVGERLERRDSALIEFPNVGLGPLFRLSVEGLDVRDNARDFGLTKDAGILTLTFRPERQVSTYIGPSLELNTAQIFGTTQTKVSVEQYLGQNPQYRNLFRVPEGTTLAFAQRVGFTWDRRDNPLGATRGTVVSGTVEHVHVFPEQSEQAAATNPNERSPFSAISSDFMRYSGRIAGYVRLNEKGLALAASVRGGINQQLIKDSSTYPDRLFFLGGVDSIRGFVQDSLVPEDIAQQLLNRNSGLTLDKVLIRGGDVFVNPRLELRIPLAGAVQTGLFLDSGNLWRDPTLMNPLHLRYAVGSGLRIATPIGPLVFDYGFNVERVLDNLYPQRSNQRYWEDIGAFHFAIGLF